MAKNVISYFLSSYIPWPNDTHCKKFTTVFSLNKTLPRVGIVSFPISGNTFTRHMIEAITGIFSGSFYLGECSALAGKKNFLLADLKFYLIFFFFK